MRRKAGAHVHEQQDACMNFSNQQQHLMQLRAKPCRGVVMTDRSKVVKAACGVKVMWVSAQARRKGIATQLLDTARSALQSTDAVVLTIARTDIDVHVMVHGIAVLPTHCSSILPLLLSI